MLERFISHSHTIAATSHRSWCVGKIVDVIAWQLLSFIIIFVHHYIRSLLYSFIIIFVHHYIRNADLANRDITSLSEGCWQFDKDLWRFSVLPQLVLKGGNHHDPRTKDELAT
jgi:hypothetical protein